MTPTTPMPAYLVYHSNPISGATRRFFTDENLLTARRAALTFIESLFTNRVQDHLYQDEMEFSLMEIATPDDPAPVLIAQLMQQENVDQDTDAYRQKKQHLFAELQREYKYYRQHGHGVGFGAMRFTLRLTEEPAPARTYIALTEAISAVMVHMDHYNNPWRPHFDFQYFDPDELIELDNCLSNTGNLS